MGITFWFYAPQITTSIEMPDGYGLAKGVVVKLKNEVDVLHLKKPMRNKKFQAFVSGKQPLDENVLKVYIAFRIQFPLAQIFFAPIGASGLHEINLASKIGFDGIVWKRSLRDIIPKLLNHNTATKQISQNGKNRLFALRDDIDQLDQSILNLLSKRQEIVRELGELKNEFHLPIVQTGRWKQILKDLKLQSSSAMLDEGYISSIFEIIHLEAIKNQIHID